MKTHLHQCPAIPTFLLATLLAGVHLDLPAQSNPLGTSTTSASSPSGPGYLLEIKDGMLQPRGSRKSAQPAKLQNLVDVLREEHPVNIVVTPAIAEVTIEFLKLRAASLEDELEALSVASGGLFVWEKGRPSARTGAASPFLDPTTGLPVMGVAAAPPTGAPGPVESESNLYILREPAFPMESRRKVEAFNLSGYLKSSNKPVPESLKEIERIVADTFEEMKGAQAAQNRPTFKFHAGANLLIVVGPMEAIEIARQVVNALPGQEQRGMPYGRPPVDFSPMNRGDGYPGGMTDPYQPVRR